MKITTSRYVSNSVIKGSNNIPYFNNWTKYNGNELISNTDIPVVMQENSRLDKLAATYLGNSNYWWMICMLNNMKHFWDWQVGDTILVPNNASKFMSYIKNNINKE